MPTLDMIAAMPKSSRALHPFDALKAKGFEIRFLSHASSIITGDFPDALLEIGTALNAIELPITEIIGSGGGETKFTQRLRRSLAAMGWRKHVFEVRKTIDGVPRESTSHEVDHVKAYAGVGVVALEIEWNNKDPFFDATSKTSSACMRRGPSAWAC